MYEVSVECDFDAAHSLRGYQGKCESLHGHRFRVVANLRVPELNPIGIAYDFVALRQHLEAILSRFDHAYLNEVPPFDGINPSSENIASTVWGELSTRLKGAKVTVSSIQVWESPESCVTYFPD